VVAVAAADVHLRDGAVESLYEIDLKHVNELTVREQRAGQDRGNFFTDRPGAGAHDLRSRALGAPRNGAARVADQLIVEVEEHEALGTWGDGRLLSVKGDVFTANIAEADDDHVLPAFDGPAGSEKEVLARFAELRSWFAPVKLVPQELALSSRYAWTVKLDNGMSVELGREQDKNDRQGAGAAPGGVYPQLVARLQKAASIRSTCAIRTGWRCPPRH
jgi:cell division protein FtsQ